MWKALRPAVFVLGLAVLLTALVMVYEARAGDPDSGTGKQALPTVNKPADPDQPQNYCDACHHGGAWINCIICSWQHVWNMGELP